MAESTRKSDAKTRRKEEEKKSLEGPMASSRGSQMGMGGSTGLEGSYAQGAGNKSGMTSVSSGYEQTPERGSAVKGTGSKARRTGDQTEPNR